MSGDFARVGIDLGIICFLVIGDVPLPGTTMDNLDELKRYAEQINSRVSNLLAEARNKALAECLGIVEELSDKTYWDDPSAGIAARIKNLITGGQHVRARGPGDVQEAGTNEPDSPTD